MPVRLELTTGETHDNRLVTELLSDLNRARCRLLIEEPWIDEAEGRVWFLFESSRRSRSSES
jgi:hypothetical protein